MIPWAIYFDTNALFQLGHGELNVDFVGLRELSKPRSDLYAPRLVVRELIQLRLREAAEQVQKLEQASRRLGYLLFRKPLECEKAKDVERTISTGIEQFFTGISARGFRGHNTNFSLTRRVGID